MKIRESKSKDISEEDSKSRRKSYHVVCKSKRELDVYKIH